MAHRESSVNWFGQVGDRSQNTQPRPQVSAPALSQVPGLNKASGNASYADEPQRQFFRDTDSAYVRLAKQGGRTDLLRMDQDSVATGAKGSGYAIPSWMQQDPANENFHNNAVERAQDICLPPAMISETRAAFTGDTLHKAWSRNSRGTSPSHQFLRKKASMDVYKMPTIAETRYTFRGKPHELEETMKPGNYEDSHQLNSKPQTLPVEAALPRTPAYSTPIKASVERQLLRDAENPSTAMQYRSGPISRTVTEEKDDSGSDAAQFYQSSNAESELGEQKEREDEWSQRNGSLNNNSLRSETSGVEAEDGRTELHHQDSTAGDKDELDFIDNGRDRVSQWDSRQNSPPPLGDQGSGYSWSRKTSADGDRQPMQTESQSAYANKPYKDDESPANWRSDRFQRQNSRQNISDAASEASLTSFQSPEQKARDNARPDWLQWNPANDSRRGSANGRQQEDSRGSPVGQRYQGNGSPQKPYADHGYQAALETETSSAYSEKPFQSPAGDRRSLTSKLPEELYSKNNYPGTSQQKPFEQPAGMNRLKHSDSMSKLMSFGYLKDSDKDSSPAGQSQPPKFERNFVANTYTTEYKEKMHGSGDASDTNSIRSHNASLQSAGGYVPTPISDPGYRRRKQSFDERPDFFKIGSTEPQSAMNYGIRKPSAETRPDFFGSERLSSAAAVSYGKIRHDADSKPDFFKIGSLDNYVERQVEEKRPDDGGILDKLNGFHGIPQKTSFRRRKMDVNGPMLTMPVKAISRF